MDNSFDRLSGDEAIEKIMTLIDERLDVEAITGAVEHLNFSNQLNEKLNRVFGELRNDLTQAFGEVRAHVARNRDLVASTQQEIRDLILDVALLKRAAASVGHIGVLERRKVERELVLELLPPSRPREGTGIQVAPVHDLSTRQVDCEARLPHCKAACCRIFDASLTVPEVESGRYDWDPKRPYALRRERNGCVHLKGGSCDCTVYHDRPQTCRTYSCENDSRIWSDFANFVINPDLAQRLKGLSVVTGSARNPMDMPSFEGPGAGGSPFPDPAAPPSPATEPSSLQGDLKSSTPGTQVAPPNGAQVAPPNFDDLRALIVPRPNKVFIPPRKDDDSGPITE